MDLTITSTRTCASMPGHQLCLDYTLPAVEKIFARFLTQHPQIPDYKNCNFLINGPFSNIDCSSAPYSVTAQKSKIKNLEMALEISLIKHNPGGGHDIESLYCDKNSCDASNQQNVNYSFIRNSDGECFETFSDNKINRRDINTKLPCDGPGSLFDEYLKHTTVTLALPQPLPPPNPPPPPQGQNTQTGGAPSGNPTSQNTSYFQTALGAAGTIYFSYKAYQESEKMDEEGRRAEATPRQNGQAANPDKKSSGHRALGYVVAAIAAGAFTLYSIRL